MSDVVYDFQTPDSNYDPPADFTITSPPGSSAYCGIASTGFLAEYFGTASSSNCLILLQSSSNSTVDASLTQTFGGSASVELDFAVAGPAGSTDSFAVYVDDVQVAATTATATWAHALYPLAPGSHVIRFEFATDATAVGDNDLPAAGIDNVVLHGVAEPSAPYARGEMVKHLGGVYIARVAAPASEPGPGDTDDWFEVVARPAAPYTPDARDLPVRAAETNPFDPGQAGLWLVLDSDGNVTGQTYVDGAA